MPPSHLKDALRSLVLEYGFAQVAGSLREIDVYESGLEHEDSRQGTIKLAKSGISEARKAKPKPTARQYISSMELPLDKEALLVDLAARFQEKSFLPTFGDIANFCLVYGIDEPKSRARASAVPRIFKFIASMEASDIRRILNERMFSGPSRLGPIADAIQQSGKARAAADSGAPPNSGS